MGEFLSPMTLIGPLGEETVEALVDTGAIFTQIPRRLLEALGVQPRGREQFVRDDGHRIECEIGTVTLRIHGGERTALCVFDEAATQPLLGSHALTGFLLGLNPVNQTLVPVVGRLKPVVL